MDNQNLFFKRTNKGIVLIIRTGGNRDGGSNVTMGYVVNNYSKLLE